MKKICLILTIVLVLSTVNFAAVSATGEERIIGIAATTDNVGNIFYNNEAIAIDFTYTNGSNTAIAAEAFYQIYQFDKNNNPVLYGEPIEMALNIAADDSTEQTVNPAADEFGLYKIVVSLSGDVAGTYETEFSRSAKSSLLNYSLGANAGDLKDNTTAVNAPYSTQKDSVGAKLDLMTNAGLGLLRTNFSWAGYESWGTENDFNLVRSSENWKVVLEESTKRELNILPILGINHPLYTAGDSFLSDFLPEENIEKFETYVRNLVNEEAFKSAKIEMVEIGNEPDIIGLSNANTTAAFAERGHKMSLIYKAAYETIENIDPEMKIGIGSLSGNWNSDKDKAFVNAFLEDFADEEYFDALTLHPYASMIKEIPEKNVIEYNDYYRNLMDTEIWHTEFGWWVGGTQNISEYMQGVYTIRQYATSLAHNNNDKFYIYNLANSGLLNDTTDIYDANNYNSEHNFGLVKNNAYTVPFAAKYAYLQIANLNKLTADKDKCEQVVDGVNNSYVTKFSSKWNDSEVYMLWTTDGSKNINYPIASEKILYYDILGNLMNEAEVKNSDGTYKLTDVPFYAVTGSDLPNVDPETGLPIDSVVVDAKTNSVTLRGYIGEEGQEVTMIALRPDADIDNPAIEDIVHIAEATTRKNGYYEFIFTDSQPLAGDYIIRYNIGKGGAGQNYKYSQAVTIPTIKILSGESKIRTLTDIKTTQLKLCVDLPKAMEAMAICAQYKNGVLVTADAKDMNAEKMEMMFDYAGSGAVDKLKVFLWEPVGYVPIIQDYKIN